MRNNNISIFQKQTLIHLSYIYCIRADSLEDKYICLNSFFKNNNYNIIEIGFGNGDNLVNLAIQYPNINFIGIEIYKKGLCKILKKIFLYRIKNIRIMYRNAYNVLCKIKKHSVYGLHILFPDPWRKVKHYKRRLLNMSFLKIVDKVLIKKGFFHISTDIKIYLKLTILNLFLCDEFFNNLPLKKSTLISKKTKFQNKNKKKIYYEVIFQKRYLY